MSCCSSMCYFKWMSSPPWQRSCAVVAMVTCWEGRVSVNGHFWHICFYNVTSHTEHNEVILGFFSIKPAACSISATDGQQNKISKPDKAIDVQIKPVNTAFDWHSPSVCELQWISLVSLFFFLLSGAIDSSANEFASCHFARQLSLSVLAHRAASGERKKAEADRLTLIMRM